MTRARVRTTRLTHRDQTRDRGDRRAPDEDTTRAAPSPPSRLYIKHDTTPPLQPSDIDKIIDGWRRRGWTG